MSVEKAKNYKIGLNDMVTGGLGAGFLFLYWQMNNIGIECNKSILKLANKLKEIIENINVLDIHFKKHLMDHKINPKNAVSSDNDLKIIYDERFKNMENRIVYLEKIIENLHMNTNSKNITHEKTHMDDTYNGFKNEEGLLTQELWKS